MIKLRLCLLLVLLSALVGCGHIGRCVKGIENETISKEYIDVLNKWTKDETVYSNFETRAHIVATWRNREFNDAYLSEYARVYFLSEADKKKKEDTLAGVDSDFTEFLFYAYIPDMESNDFSKMNSVWKIFLVSEDGRTIGPLEIRKIKKINPVVKKFFPYVDPYYGITYSLRFPVPPSFPEGGGHIKLIFTSVMGKVEFKWQVQEAK
jgi:hypothetical protein